MSPRSVYIWCGKGSTGDEREMAKKIAVEGKADPTIVSEGWYFLDELFVHYAVQVPTSLEVMKIMEKSGKLI